MAFGFFAQVTDATVTLVTRFGPVFNSIGIGMFKGIAVSLVVWEGFKVAFHVEPPGRIAGLLVSLAITYSALVYYSAPFPGVGKNLHQIVTDAGVEIAQQIDTASEQQLGELIANVQGSMSGSAWQMVVNTPQALETFIIAMALSAVQIVMLAIIAFGFVAVGVIVLLGPIMIPFLPVPYLDWLATGWFRALIQYSFYPVVGNAFVFVYGTVWINYFAQYSGPMDSQRIAGLFVQLIVISMAGVFGILKVPQLVSHIFSGSSGIGAFPGFGWWR